MRHESVHTSSLQLSMDRKINQKIIQNHQYLPANFLTPSSAVLWIKLPLHLLPHGGTSKAPASQRCAQSVAQVGALASLATAGVLTSQSAQGSYKEISSKMQIGLLPRNYYNFSYFLKLCNYFFCAHLLALHLSN